MMNIIRRFFGKKYYQEKVLGNYKDRLSKNVLYPKLVQWIATYKCNFHCDHCGTGAGDPLPDEINTEEIKKVIDALSQMGTYFLSVTGGEPILRDDIFEVLKYAKSKGIAIGLVSNGYATEDYIKELEKLKLDSILISIDGYKENHDKLRSKRGSYERCIRSLDIYKNLGVGRRAVSTVIMKENVDDLSWIIEDVWKHGINVQRVQAIVPEGRAYEWKKDSETIKQAFRIVSQYRKRGYEIYIGESFGFLGPLNKIVRGKKRREFFCGAGWNTFTIMHNGAIMGCPAIEFPNYSEGNIKDKSVKKIWENYFNRFRGKFIKDLHKKCKKCKYLHQCRGGCWLYMVNGDPCFIEEAEEVAKELGLK